MPDGKFITFEGGEGAGKSTQVRLLAESLRQSGISVTETREPGGSPGAEAIRELLVTGGTDRWSGAAEALLNYAARRDHMERTILPALEQGAWVICDRFADSTMAYQGYGHQLGADWVTELHQTVMADFKPDLTLVFDIAPEQGLKRANSRSDTEDRYERMDAEFHDRLRDGFLKIAAAEPERCAVLDASGSVEDIQAEIFLIVRDRLGLDS
ncbi:MAG: dTMP kinase [Rhodospirillaceae bacterium]|nr:dTMP kinase [Rhodospirillaceae bacterium]MBT7487247.1 dTMP kinase [Rhodospirillales bacterium]MBT4702048.1 dTMP kinase [Rhodospirillaceae bacterium]MBT5033965.1 dTMP kinase [Rhodospirillaceae bacterium]MBT6222082.1 dTMP kinase [Rhodospirillaceae bacterium]